ncbi:MAG: hypothetical protein LBP27_03740, partial [Treponema sp.]|nr:hypothetical protein [Treponema sp.]
MRIFRRVSVTLFLLLLFSTCGELDTVLPSSGTYRVNVLVNDVSLDECSLVRDDDKIRPYFATSVAEDPDVTGLVIYLQNVRGEVSGGKIRYALRSAENGKAGAADERTAAGEESPEKMKSGTNAEAGSAGYADNAGNIDNMDNAAGTETVKGTDAGKTALHGNPEYAETLIRVESLDRNLPFFPLPENLKTGLYTMIFRVLGKGPAYGEEETLYQIEKFFYYLGDSGFALSDVRMYLPGSLNMSRLIPPGTVVMLEARAEYDKTLDPYIVWYNGRKRIGGGRLADGAGTMLWKTPEQTGFHAVRAEVFPYQIRENIAGISRVISLPVSAKASAASFFSEKYGGSFTEDNPNLIHWYQFRGSLQDSKKTVSTERALIPVGGESPKWLPCDNSYGLSTGTDRVYLMPPVSFYREGGEEGGGRFLVRFTPVSEGPVLDVSFGSKSSPEENAAIAELFLKDGKTVLRLSVPEGAAEEITLPVYASPDYHVAVLVDFYLNAKRLDAKICFESGSGFQPEHGSIDLTVPPGGEARVRLGAPAKGGDGKTGSAPNAKNAGVSAESGMPPKEDASGRDAFDRESSGEPEFGDRYSVPGDAPADASPAAGNGEDAVVRIIWDELAVLRLPVSALEEKAAQPFPGEDPDPVDDPGFIPPAKETAAVSGQEGGEQAPLAANPDTAEPAKSAESVEPAKPARSAKPV